MDRCYDCRTLLNQENSTREHIPAQNTFAGYPPEYKNNRLTVPACHTCNNEYSKIDQEIRDAIGIQNDENEEQQELTRKSVKSIMRRANWLDRLHFSNGKVIAVTFSYDDFQQLHIKNFKGIFHHKYGSPLPADFEIFTIAEGDEENANLMGIAKSLYSYVEQGDNWQISGHEDIFQFKIKSLTPSPADLIEDDPNIENALGFVAVLKYHKTLTPVIIAAKTEFMEKIKQSHVSKR